MTHAGRLVVFCGDRICTALCRSMMGWNAFVKNGSSSNSCTEVSFIFKNGPGKAEHKPATAGDPAERKAADGMALSTKRGVEGKVSIYFMKCLFVPALL